MTARSLFDSLPARNTRLSVGQNKKFLIVNCILQALGLPLVMLVGILTVWEDAASDTGRYVIMPSLELYAVVGVLCLAAATVLGIPAAISAYPELWKRSKVDMIYSLPLTGRQRYFSHYLSGCALYLAPFAAAVILGWGILLVGCGAVASLGAENYTWAILSSEVFWRYAMATIGLLLLMWLYYTAAVLFTSCTGTLFESIYTNILFNLLVPGTLAAVIASVTSRSSTMSFNWYGIEWTSPIGGLIYLCTLVSGEAADLLFYSWRDITGSEVTHYNMWTPFLLWGLRIILLTAALLVLGWQLYVRRKAEDVSKPFPYKALYFVMLTMVTVLILCLVNLSSDLIGPALLMAAIVYLIMEIIRKRGFKRFWVSILSYAGTAAAVLVMIFIVDVTNCFSREYAIPSTFSVTSVRVDVNADLGSSYYDSGVDLEYTDRDVIAAIHSLQKEIIREYKENGSTTEKLETELYTSDYRTLTYDDGYAFDDPYAVYSYEDYPDTYSVSYDEKTYQRKPLEYYDFASRNNYAVPTRRVRIMYTTTLGSQVVRTYTVNPDQYLRLMETLHRTDLYASAASASLRESCLSYDTDHNSGGYTLPATSFYLTSPSGVSQGPCKAGADAADRISAAYYEDLREMTIEDLRESGIYGYISGARMPVWNCNTRTIEILKELGLEDFTLKERYAGDDEDTDYTYDQYGYGSAYMMLRLYEPGTYMAPMKNYGAAPDQFPPLVDTGADAFTGTIYPERMSVQPELSALLEAAKGIGCFTTDTDCWMMNISGRWYYIDGEDTDIVQAYMDSYDSQDFWGTVPGPAA